MSEYELCPKCGSILNNRDNDEGRTIYRCTNNDCNFIAHTDEEYQLKKQSIDDEYTIRNLRIMLQGATKIETDLRNDVTTLQSTITAQEDIITALKEDAESLFNNAGWSKDPHNHTSGCPKGVIGLHQNKPGDCICGYDEAFKNHITLMEKLKEAGI